MTQALPTKKPFIPTLHRQQVFQCFHGLGLLGTNATMQLLWEKVVWLGIRMDTREWGRQCEVCQAFKIHKHTITLQRTAASLG